MQRAKMAKNEEQKIRLIMNIITPENKEKKFKELREYMFPDMVTKQEFEGKQWDINIHGLNDEKYREDILNVIV